MFILHLFPFVYRDERKAAGVKHMSGFYDWLNDDKTQVNPLVAEK